MLFERSELLYWITSREAVEWGEWNKLLLEYPPKLVGNETLPLNKYVLDKNHTNLTWV